MTDTPPPPERPKRSTKLSRPATTVPVDENPTPPVAVPRVAVPPAPAAGDRTRPADTGGQVPVVALMAPRDNPWRDIAQSGNRLPQFLDDALAAISRSSGGAASKRHLFSLAVEHYLTDVLGRADVVDAAWEHCGGPRDRRDDMRPR